MSRLKLKITGKSLKYFLDLLIKKKINIYYLEQHKNYLIIVVSIKDYKQITKIKTTAKLEILNRYGPTKGMYLLDKYKYLIISFLITLIFLIFLSSLTFDIEVIHQKQEIRDIIHNDLERFGLKKYSLKMSYQKKEQLKEKILKTEKDKIEWLEIENIGTKYIINVEERKKNKLETSSNPQDIVAKKDALISSIEAEQGEVVKKKYDYVKRGDVIISGIIKNKDTPVSKIRAKGKILGEVWYKVIVYLPKHYHEEKYTNRNKKVLKLKFLTKNHTFFDFNKYKNYKIKETLIIKNHYLPIQLTLDTKKEIEVVDEKYNLKTCNKKATALAEKSIKRKIKKESTIKYKKTLKKELKNSKIIVEVFFKVEEDITKTRDLSNVSLEELVEE